MSVHATWLLFCRRLFVGWTCIYVVVSFSLGGAALAKPMFRGLALFWLLLISGLTWYSRKLPSPTAGPRTGKFFRFLELILTNVAVTLFLAEATLRLYAALTGPAFFLSTVLEAHRLSPGRDYGHGLRGNRLGYPGPDPSPRKSPGIRRIAAVGDSFAVGPAVAFDDNYLTLLDKKLPSTEVLNFGVSGAGPREYLAIVQQHVERFEPDQILVSIFVGNDITERLPTPRYLAPDSHAVYVLCRRAWCQLREQSRQATPPCSWNRLQRPPLSRTTFREVEARRLQVCVTPVNRSMQKKWRRTLSDLERLIQFCRRRQRKLAVVLIPDEFQVNRHVRQLAARDAKVLAKQIDVSLPQRRLAQFFAAHEVPCLDLLPYLEGQVELYAERDTHWNRHGNHRAATVIADWLRREELTIDN